MTNRIAIILIVVVVVLAVVGITACTPTSEDPDTDASAYTEPTASNTDPLATNSAGVQAQQTTIPNISAPDIDYSDFIPEIKFGDLICSFVQNKEGTFLYSDVSYDDVVKYADKIKDMGYDLKSEDGSKRDDSYQAELYDEDQDVTVYLKYSESGLSIKVIPDKDN